MNYKNLEFNVVKIIVTFVREMEMFYSQKDYFYLPKENLGANVIKFSRFANG